VSARGEARRSYEAALRSEWDNYRSISVERVGGRITKKSGGAIMAAHAGNVTRLVDCLRGRKVLANDDASFVADFIATKVPRKRWPKRVGDALSNRTDADYDILADFVEKLGRGRGRQRNEPVHAAARLTEVMLTLVEGSKKTAKLLDATIADACKMISRETGTSVPDEQVRELLNRPKKRRRKF